MQAPLYEEPAGGGVSISKASAATKTNKAKESNGFESESSSVNGVSGPGPSSGLALDPYARSYVVSLLAP